MTIRLTRTTFTSFTLLGSIGLCATTALAQDAVPTEPPAAPDNAPTPEAPDDGQPGAREPEAISPADASTEPPADAPTERAATDGSAPETSIEEAAGEAEDTAVDGEVVADQGPPPVDSDLSAVYVTANRREEKIQDVPISISVAGSQQILDQNLTTSNDVERLTPNLTAQASTGRFNKPRWFLRGIGTNDPSVNLEAPIGVYQDEVFVAFATSQAFPLFDLERIEVLKGPQGSLWGKNTIAGAVHYISKKPSFDTASGYARASIGNFGSRVAEAAYGGPVIADRIAARASFVYEEQEGWATNIRDGSLGPQFTDLASRLQLLANVTDDIDVQIIGRYRAGVGGGNPSYPIGVRPDGGIHPNPAIPESDIFYPSYGTTPRSGDPYFAGVSANTLGNSGITGIINIHIDDYTLTSITGYDRADTDSRGNGYAPFSSWNQTGSASSINSQQFSQELRFTSPREDRFNWIAGLHYWNWALDSTTYNATFGPRAPATSYTSNYYDQLATSYAAFASARFNVTEPFAINAGLRYTNDRKDATARRLFAAGAPGAPIIFNDQGNVDLPSSVDTPLAQTDISRNAWWGQVTYDLTPEYKINENILAYARFARGFKSGTFNPTIIRNASGNAELPQTDPEVLWAWEAGAKTQWFGGKLTANLAGFYYLIEGIQLNVQQANPQGLPGLNGSVVSNAAGGTVLGAELELDARPIENLRLSGGLGLLKSEYTDFITFEGAEEVDASGNQIYRAANSSFTVSVEYKIPLNETQALAIGTDWRYIDHVYFNAIYQNDPIQEQQPYALGNAELRYLLDNGNLVFQGYVRNLTDQDFAVFTSVISAGANNSSRGQPRSFGIQAIAKF